MAWVQQERASKGAPQGVQKIAQKIAMCPPDFFDVHYVINPWMNGNCGQTDRTLAQQQWQHLRDALAAHADIVLVPPQPGLPDMVFTANAGTVLGGQVVVSRFRSPERQGEEPHFRAWFKQQGFEIAVWPESVAFEGAGDALWDRKTSHLWLGCGFRSSPEAPERLAAIFGSKVQRLNLVDPRFYHLDTCFCPLEGGFLMYYPGAFDAMGLRLIASQVLPSKRIEVARRDALGFCCNAVELEGHVFMNAASEGLQAKLRELGFAPVITPLGEFMKAGGAAKCLTLKLVEN